MESRLLAPNLSCFSWNHDWTEIAFSPHNEEVHICTVSTEPPQTFSPPHILRGHEGVVSAIQWSPAGDLIATCSHDVQTFVFVRTETGWEQQLVQMRISRAALCLEWCPTGSKFAVGSSDKSVTVCHYAPQHNWWVSSSIRGKHKSSVTSAAWHPNGWLLATASTDGACRVFNAIIKDVDDCAAASAVPPDSKFGQLLWKVEAGSGWVHDVAWTSGGEQLAFCTHGSCVHFSAGLDFRETPNKDKMQVDETVHLPDLPLKHLHYAGGGLLLGGGWGGTVMVLQQHPGGSWQVMGPAECLPGAGDLTHRRSWETSSVATRVGILRAQSGRPSSPFANAPASNNGQLTKHSKCIVGLVGVYGGAELRPAGSNDGLLICSGGLDGRLMFWRLPSLEGALASLQI